MSRLDDLLAEHCPHGVDFLPLGDLVNYEQPGKYLVASTDYDDSFETPVLTAGQTFVLGYTDETNGLYRASPEKPVVIFDDFTTAFKWVDFPFKAKSSAMKMLTPKPNAPADFRFVYYAMQTIPYQPQDHARQWIAKYSNFEIPVPPTSVQGEIVSILDKMEMLRADLDAELSARRRQYAHYRDRLLSFSERERVRWAPMREVGEFIRGKRFTKADYEDAGIPCIHYGEIYTHFGTSATSVVSHLRRDIAAGLRYAQPGDVVIVDVGETVEDVGKAVAWLGDEPVAIHDHSYAFRHELNPAFVSYVTQTSWFRREKAKYIARTKVNTLLVAGFSKIEIPVPSLDEQERIVAILDKFDALVNDLSIGLPAEIAARRRQFEYYRDTLLTFGDAA